MSLGGFDDWFKLHYEDVDLNLRAKKESGKAFYCPKSIIYHKQSLTVKSQIKSDFLIFHVRKNRLQVISKNFAGFSKLYRFLALIPYYLFWSIRNSTTLKSIWGFLNHQFDHLFNLWRFIELKKLLKIKF